MHRFGTERVIDTPISELGLAGAAVGAALTGMRPVLEIQFSDFVTLAMEQIVNQAAKIRFMFGGKASVPMVVRLPGGSGTGAAAQHSQSLEAWFAHVPGLKVVQPSTPHDAKGLLLAAIDDPNPVLIFEHKLLYKTKGPVPAEAYRVPIGKAAVRREGRDVTIVASSIMTLRALAAAERLAAEGIDAEVIDLRSLRPIDFADDRARACARRAACSIVYEGVKTMGIGAEIAALVAESDVFHALAAPIARLGGADSPIPYNPGAGEGGGAAGRRHRRRRAAARARGQARDGGDRSDPAQGRHGHGVGRHRGVEGRAKATACRRATSCSRWRPASR